MESSRWDPNAEIVCPYDVTHVLSVKRFQRHLVKCRQVSALLNVEIHSELSKNPIFNCRNR